MAEGQTKIKRCAEKLCLDVRELSLGNGGKIERIEGPPSPLRFLRDFVLPNKPCIITHAIDHWPALAAWTNSYLIAILQNQQVSVHMTPDGYADALVDLSVISFNHGPTINAPTLGNEQHFISEPKTSADASNLKHGNSDIKTYTASTPCRSGCNGISSICGCTDVIHVSPSSKSNVSAENQNQHSLHRYDATQKSVPAMACNEHSHDNVNSDHAYHANDNVFPAHETANGLTHAQAADVNHCMKEQHSTEDFSRTGRLDSLHGHAGKSPSVHRVSSRDLMGSVCKSMQYEKDAKNCMLQNSSCDFASKDGLNKETLKQTWFLTAHVERLPFPTALDLILHSSIANGVVYAQEQNDCFLSEYSALAADADVHLPWASEALGCMPEAVNLWIGNEKAVTSFHKDHYENLYAVIAGAKHFTLLPPTDVHRLYIQKYPSARFVKREGKFSVEQEKLAEYVPWVSVDPYPSSEVAAQAKLQFPEYFKGPKPFTCTLQAGEILYLPSMWFHHVRQSPDAEGRTIALNYWYDMHFDIKYAYFNFLESLITST